MSGFSLDYPHRDAHIRNLEAIATLFGMQPKPVDKCRVLQIGAGSGGHLLPQAADYPQSEFVGVEASQAKVSVGSQICEDIAVKNVSLKRVKLQEIDASWGEFDYILCLDLYSHVTAEIRQQLMKICQERLSPQGVALVNWNVFPGWNQKKALRDMLRYHTAAVSEPAEKLHHAKALLLSLVKMTSEHTAYGKCLREELELLKQQNDQYLMMHYLGDYNEPLYFEQFAGEAHTNGLQYLAESVIARMLPQNLPPSAQQSMQGLDLYRQEQYIDFIRNVAFRSTLLCHQEITLKRELQVESLQPFQVALTTQFTNPPEEITDEEPHTFEIGQGKITVRLPLAKAALTHLNQIWPSISQL